MQLLEAARYSVLPDWEWRSIVPKAQNDRIWRIIIVHLATLGRRSTNDSSLYSQSSRKKVERKGDILSKACKEVITSEVKDRNTNIRRGKIPDVFGIPAGRIFYVSKRGHVRVKEDFWSPYILAGTWGPPFSRHEPQCVNSSRKC